MIITFYQVETHRTPKYQNCGMCPGQFLENGWKKQNAIYRDSSTVQAVFKSTNRSKIGSLYGEIFQRRGTVPNDKNDPFRVPFPNQTQLTINTPHNKHYEHNWGHFVLDDGAYGTHNGLGEQVGRCWGEPTEGWKTVYLGGLGGSFAEWKLTP